MKDFFVKVFCGERTAHESCESNRNYEEVRKRRDANAPGGMEALCSELTDENTTSFGMSPNVPEASSVSQTDSSDGGGGSEGVSRTDTGDTDVLEMM